MHLIPSYRSRGENSHLYGTFRHFTMNENSFLFIECMTARLKVDLWSLWMKVVIQFGFKAQVHVLLQIAHLSVHTVSKLMIYFCKGLSKYTRLLLRFIAWFHR